MISNKNNKTIITTFTALIILFIVFAVLTISSSATSKSPSSDDDQYITMGYNIYKYGTFSLDKDDKPNPGPTAYREPGYPTYLALMMLVNPILNDMSRSELYEEGLKILRYMQIPLVVIISFLSMYIIVKITGNIIYGYFILFLIGSSNILEVTANHLLSENLTTVFLLLVSILLYKIYEDNKIYYFILLGITCGLLVLCKFTFMFLPIIIIILFIISFFTNWYKNKKKTVAGIILFIILFSTILGGWMTRNYIHFNSFTTGGQGGIVLLVRAKKNLMSFREYAATFIYWLPGGTKINEKVFVGYFNENDFKRFNDDNENSFLYIARNERRKIKGSLVESGYTEQEALVLTDKIIKSEALVEIIKNPGRHIICILPFAWRGIFIETGYSYKLPGSLLTIEGASFMIILNIFLIFAFFYQFISCIKRKSWGIFFILIPPMFLFLINSFLSHNKPRYNIPILPFLVIASFLLISSFFDRNEEVIKKAEAAKKFCKE